MRIQHSHNNKKMMLKFFSLALIAIFAISIPAQQRKSAPAATTAQMRAITVVTEPKAIVWLDDVKRGQTDESGKLTFKFSLPGTRKLRVRADGFKETTQNLLPTQKGEIKIALVKTTDEAELAYQQAEKLAATDKQKASELYEKALKLRPQYAEAQLGLARVLADEGNLDEALAAIQKARKLRPAYAEASAVEGRIYKSEGDEEKAIASYKRAIAEGKGFQPEAHTGIAIIYKEKAEAAGAAGDFQEEEVFYTEAAKSFKSALSQLSGAPDAEIIYQLLGLGYEKMKKYKDAIAVYEEFLRVFPNSNEASAVQSFIVQLKKQMNNE